MTEAEIAELFIQAAEIDRRLPATGTRPRGFFGLGQVAVHTDEDRAGWAKVAGDFIAEGDDPRAEEAARVWAGATMSPTREHVALWELAMSLVAMLDDFSERRALWAWAASRAIGYNFASRCRREGIHPETGRWRKDRAIAKLARKPLQHNQNAGFPLLAITPENAYVSDMVETVANEAERPVFDAEHRDF